MTIPPILVSSAPDNPKEQVRDVVKGSTGTGVEDALAALKLEPSITIGNKHKGINNSSTSSIGSIASTVTHNLNPRAELKPFTCGGEEATSSLLLVPLEAPHLQPGGDGAEPSLGFSTTLWSIIPAHMRQSELREEYELWHKVANETGNYHRTTARGDYDMAELTKAVTFVEESFLSAQLHALSRIHRGLTKEGYTLPHPLQILGPRKTASKVEPLAVVVRRAQDEKPIGDQSYKAGFALHAIKVYWFALVNMYPWIATPLIFTPKVAFETGLARFQCTLWLHLANAIRRRALQLKPVGGTATPNSSTSPPEGTATSTLGLPHDWMSDARMCASIVLNTRFIRRSTLARAYSLIADIDDDSNPSAPPNSEDNKNSLGFPRAPVAAAAAATVPAPSPASVPVPAAVDILSTPQLRAQNQRRLGELIRASEAANKDTTDCWAHELCVANHAGCGCGPADLAAQSPAADATVP